ncbi:MAG TPA: TetR/AcrR family transcriptional regulator [Gaiellaceae bacterium]|nr:TetR/AcrR family transcriptional regulator [Gaiellaceae bacterium]
MSGQAAPGRPRDPTIDGRVLETARGHLAEHGYERLSLAAVADEAGTTRPALYRRWPGKAELATAAIVALSTAASRQATDDPYADLIAELTAFRSGVTRPDGLSLVGTMLQRGTDPELVRLYRERLVIPRRTRLRAILERAVAGGLVPGGDLDLAVASLTGSFYALALTGTIPTRWPTRAAAHAWRSLGGTPPADSASAERDGRRP